MWSHCPVGTSKSGSVDEDVEQLELSHTAVLTVKTAFVNILFGGLPCFSKGIYIDKLHP